MTRGLFLFACWLAACLTLPAAETATSPHPAPLKSFELKDQFGTNHVCRFPAAKPKLLVLADRKGHPEIESWVKPMHEEFAHMVSIEGVADVSSVPSPLRGFVRDRFKAKVPYAVMLDWEGDVWRQFKPRKGIANVYLVTPSGSIDRVFHGKATSEKLQELGKRIKILAASAPPAR